MPDRHERIDMLYGLRRYAEAEKLAREQIAETPHDAHAYAQLAMCLSPIDGPKYERAIDAAKASLKHDASQSFAHYIHGWLLRRTNRIREAEESLHEALRQSPFYVNARVELANLELERDHKTEARTLVRVGLNDFPNNADLLELQARIELGDNRNIRAEDTIRTAMNLYPTDARFHYLLAYKQERDGQELKFSARRAAYRQAHASMREAMRLDPTNTFYHETDARIRKGMSWWRSVVHSPNVSETSESKGVGGVAFVVIMIVVLFIRGIAGFNAANNPRPAQPQPVFNAPRQQAPAEWEQKWLNNEDRQRTLDLIKRLEQQNDLSRPRPTKK